MVSATWKSEAWSSFILFFAQSCLWWLSYQTLKVPVAWTKARLYRHSFTGQRYFPIAAGHPVQFYIHRVGWSKVDGEMEWEGGIG